MNDSLPTASVQYNDLTGTCAVDWHSGTEFHDFASSKGIDTKRNFPLSLTIYGAKFISFTIYAVDTDITDQGFDTISEYAQNNNGNLPVVKFNFTSSIEELSNYLKRLSIALNPRMPALKTYEITDEIHLD